MHLLCVPWCNFYLMVFYMLTILLLGILMINIKRVNISVYILFHCNKNIHY